MDKCAFLEPGPLPTGYVHPLNSDRGLMLSTRNLPPPVSPRMWQNMYDFFEILSLILQITGFAYLCLVGSNYTGAEYISESELSCLIEVINKSCFTYAEIKQTLFH